jgi:hypothetical protein
MPSLTEQITITGSKVRFPVQTTGWTSANSATHDLPLNEYWTGFLAVTRDPRTIWDRLSDRLSQWEADPSAVEDDGLPPPSRLSISVAKALMRGLQSAGFPGSGPVLQVVPSVSGGIVIECRSGDEYLAIEVAGAGAIEISIFRKGRLIHHEILAG